MHPFGHGKAENISGVVKGILIAVKLTDVFLFQASYINQLSARRIVNRHCYQLVVSPAMDLEVAAVGGPLW